MIKNAMVGRGRTADVYEWENGFVLKLFTSEYNSGIADYEAKVTAMAYSAGLPVPKINGTVTVENRRGIVYERVDGQTMLEALGKKPWKIFKLARLMADLHAQMHEKSAPDMPSQRQRLAYAINHADTLGPDAKQAVLKALEELPDGTAVCHGDLHPDNIMLSRKGPYIIDWNNAVIGSPLADVARTCIIFESSYFPEEIPAAVVTVIRLLRKMFLQLYLKRYMRLRHVSKQQIGEWKLPVAAARLIEKVPGEEPQLLKYINSAIGA